LRELVNEEIRNSAADFSFEQDVSEFITEITDKKRARRLKNIRKEVDSWIEQMDSQEKMDKKEYV